MPKTKEIITKKIVAMAGTMTPGKIRQKLLIAHQAAYVPKERAIYDIIKKNKDRIKNNPIDAAWSLASLTAYPISYEFIPTLLLIQDTLKGTGGILSIRDAIWICRLIKVPVANPINEHSTEKEIQLFYFDLMLDAADYALQEHICEIDGNAPNTSIFDAPNRQQIRENINKSYAQEFEKKAGE